MIDIERDLPYWAAFGRVPTVGSVRIGLLEERFGSLEAAWQATTGELESAGLTANTVQAIEQVRRVTDPEREIESTRAAGVTVLTWHSAEYPRLLREIDDPPPVLYARGALEPNDEPRVTVVGTRSPTVYGKDAARHLAGDLARSGVAVVSGLARGIDGVAHTAALDAGGRTIAVMGSGLDIVYPPEHSRLMERIVEQGAVLSEQPLGAKPEARHFPRRNRLLSGLSLGTLVIEAGEGSGTLSTVRFALEQNRDVLSVPGSIYSPASELTNRLIQEGAKLVATVEDILEELQMGKRPRQAPMPGLAAEGADGAGSGAASAVAAAAVEAAAETEDERLLLDALGSEPRHIDELSRETNMPATQIMSVLTVLEMKGAALQVGRMHYIRGRGAQA